jgi:hypothetical protein
MADIDFCGNKIGTFWSRGGFELRTATWMRLDSFVEEIKTATSGRDKQKRPMRA